MDFSQGLDFPNPKVGILDKCFKKVDSCKFLGVFINSNLKWDEQSNNVATQVSKSCGSLYFIRNHVPTKVLIQVYLSLVQTYHLELRPFKFPESLYSVISVPVACVDTGIGCQVDRLDNVNTQ